MLAITTFSEQYESDVSDLILGIQRDEFGIGITLSDQPDLKMITEFYQTGAGNFWCATIDNKVIGTLGLLDIGDHRVALRKMFVASAFRGKSYGTAQALMDKALKWCEENEVNEILLGTITLYKAAQRFYERNGFERVQIEDLPSSFPRMFTDDVFYRKVLGTAVE